MIDTSKEISKVTVDNTSIPLYEKPTQTKTVTPTTQEQVVNADDGYNLSSVMVEAVNSDIDSNIQPTNIRQGITILGVEGNLAPDKPDQTKDVTPTTSQQIVVADTGYELAQVTVNAVTNDIDSNIIPENIKERVSILGVEGNFKGGTENKLPQLVDGSITTITAEDLNNITEIRDYAFYQYSNLQSINIPDSVTSIGQSAFQGCSSLTTVAIGNGVTSIGSDAFNSCSSLTSINIPASVTIIEGTAFQICTQLQRVVYQGQVPDIQRSTFSNCNRLSLYDFRNCTTVPTLYSTASLGHFNFGCKIIVPDALYDTWTTADIWSDLTNVTFVKASEYVE